jgi:hypothetical protein
MNKIAKRDMSVAIATVADEAARKLSTLDDVVGLRLLVEDLGKWRRIAAEVTKKREDINRISEPMVEAIVKAGRMLREAAEKGERHSGRGGDRKSTAAAAVDRLTDLGFTDHRARRWQLAALLPDAEREALRQKALDSDDVIWCLAILLRAAKDHLGKQQQRDSVEPSTASIVHARWQDWLPDQPDCDLLLTDPLYSTDVDDIDAFAREWLPVGLKKVKATGRAYVCIGAYPKEIAAYLAIKPPKHLIFSQVLVWTYRNRVGPSPTHDYKLNWQAILYYRGVDAPPLNCSRAVSDYPDLSEQFSVQDINLPDPRRYESWHTWQKPDELGERFIRHATQPGDLVLDPFAGTGSFLLSAASLGRRAIGCDASEEMVALARQRGVQ